MTDPRIQAIRPDEYEMREWWRSAGGRFHGPNVEQAYIEERLFFKFVHWLIEKASKPLLDQLEALQSQAKEHAALMREAADMMSDVIPATAEGLITKLRDAADRAEGKI